MASFRVWDGGYKFTCAGGLARNEYYDDEQAQDGGDAGDDDSQYTLETRHVKAYSMVGNTDSCKAAYMTRALYGEKPETRYGDKWNKHSKIWPLYIGATICGLLHLIFFGRKDPREAFTAVNIEELLPEVEHEEASGQRASSE